MGGGCRWGRCNNSIPSYVLTLGIESKNLLGYGIPMVRFHGLCDGKIMVRKTVFFWILCGNVYFFSKNFSARYLTVKFY